MKTLGNFGEQSNSAQAQEVTLDEIQEFYELLVRLNKKQRAQVLTNARAGLFVQGQQ